MSYSVSHDFLQEKLLNSGATAGASEAHGTLCGTISSAGKAPFQDWVRQVLGQAPVSGDVLMAEVAGLLEEVFVESETGMASDLYEFELLLPNDDQPLTDRVRALG
ncbi:MAG TPA: YecA family protein, partial [Gammaproteobacteria bacterium]|nr:YecA family protein [Gammaproteobacteria bacterium]